ncbi:DUF124-domain-containing protein [Panus rudis PR-1116 ss-1]|nr:DUF124-domain-containing protein [Panus rudis PR-1116 ss-1]
MSHPPSGYPGMPQAPYPPQGYPAPAPHGHHPQQGHPQQAQGTSTVDTTGAIEGLQFRIDHRDSNSLLTLHLQPGYEIKAKPGSMVAMDPSVKIRGKLKFSFSKLLSGGEMSESKFTGPGELLLAPEVWGDIIPIVLDGQTPWSVGKDAFLAASQQVEITRKSQGLGKALFSGEGLFVRQVTGHGVIFVQSLGAIVRRQLGPGQQWIVDNGHLVAWSAKYSVERIDAGGLISSMHTDEGLVCRFTGPGTVYLQTRNPEALTGWIREQLPDSSE